MQSEEDGTRVQWGRAAPRNKSCTRKNKFCECPNLQVFLKLCYPTALPRDRKGNKDRLQSHPTLCSFHRNNMCEKGCFMCRSHSSSRTGCCVLNISQGNAVLLRNKGKTLTRDVLNVFICIPWILLALHWNLHQQVHIRLLCFNKWLMLNNREAAFSLLPQQMSEPTLLNLEFSCSWLQRTLVIWFEPLWPRVKANIMCCIPSIS